MKARWFYVCSILTLVWPGARAEVVLGVEDDEFDFDGLPGAQHEFKVEVGAGREECYYQMVKAGGKIHVSFEVFKGGDMEIGLNLYDLTDNVPIATNKAAIRAGFTTPITNTGPYAICLDNTMSMMHSKLVYVYYVTYVEAEWAQYQQEIQDLQVTVVNFTSSIDQVAESIRAANLQQADMRRHVLRDYYLIMGNNKYIQQWSILQCVVVIGCSCIQVFFVRRLFRSHNVTPTHKPRA